MRRGDPLPRVWLAPGAVDDPRALLRFGPLDEVALPVGPVVVGRRRAPRAVLGTGVGGVEHLLSPGYTVAQALDLLRWAGTRGISCALSVRGGSTGELAEVVGAVHRSLEADAVGSIEVDLRGADDQAVLKAMARVREGAPRDLLLLARLSALDPELVAVARAAVAGGAGAVVVCGSVRMGEGRWWSGPSTATLTRSGVRTLTAAAEDNRWPAVPLVAAGGVHDVRSARDALASGAAAVQLGTALWADPTLLWQIADDLRPGGAPP